MHWLTGWVERDRAGAHAELAEVLAGEQWIIDGNYGSSLPMRLERADTVIWLDYPTRVCLTRVLKRWWRFRGRSRPDMTEGCPEQLSFRFLLYLLHFRSAWRGRNSAALGQFAGTILRFGSSDQLDRWLAAQPAQQITAR
jgi:adenylate kinase family enzyme